MTRESRGALRRVFSSVAAALAITLTLWSIEATPAVAAGGGGSPVAVANDEGQLRAPVRAQSDEGWFKGHFEPTSFEVVGEQLIAHGLVEGIVKQDGERARHVTEEVSLPVMNLPPSTGARASGPGALAASATCDVLNLVLGPLDLNLLGLEIHLDQIVLDIVANPAGGLLGDLLCAIANLLDGGPVAGLLEQLVGLLEQILGVLNT